MRELLEMLKGCEDSDRPEPKPATIKEIQDHLAFLSNAPTFNVGDVVVLDRLIPNCRWKVGTVAVVAITDPAKLPVVSIERGESFYNPVEGSIGLAVPHEIQNGGLMFAVTHPAYFRLATPEEIEEANTNPKPAM